MTEWLSLWQENCRHLISDVVSHDRDMAADIE